MIDKVKIGSKFIGAGEPTFIVAEAGVNHQGKLHIAKMLIDIAVDAGADAVKFQKRSLKGILTKEGLEKPYGGPHSFGETYGEHRRVLELSGDDYIEIKRYCDENDIIFLASAWDKESADFLEELDVPAYKMASADLTNTPLLEHIAEKGKPVILSTGMSNMDEIEHAVDAVRKYTDQIIVMQCTSTYPSKFEDIHLETIKTLAGKFNVPVGYSGHELGIAISLAAVVMGAVIIERHFTIDRTMKGGDHAASLEPVGLKKLVRDIRAFEMARGSAEKRLLESEIPVREKLAKSIVSGVDILKGTEITKGMLTAKGPGTGFAPYQMDLVVGKKAGRDIKEDTIISQEDLQ